jgi:hypothetical protein
VDLIGNGCKLNLRLFLFLFYWGDAWVMGVFTQRNGLNARIIIGKVFGLRRGLELGSEDANNGYRR